MLILYACSKLKKLKQVTQWNVVSLSPFAQACFPRQLWDSGLGWGPLPISPLHKKKILMHLFVLKVCLVLKKQISWMSALPSLLSMFSCDPEIDDKWEVAPFILIENKCSDSPNPTSRSFPHRKTVGKWSVFAERKTFGPVSLYFFNQCFTFGEKKCFWRKVESLTQKHFTPQGFLLLSGATSSPTPGWAEDGQQEVHCPMPAKLWSQATLSFWEAPVGNSEAVKLHQELLLSHCPGDMG